MSIIYSYPETTSLNDNDTLIGTSSALVGGKKKNITRNFSLGEIRDYVSSGGVINPAATDFKLAVFNQNGTKITDSIVSQDALTGTGIVVAGTLRSTAATFNGLITGSQGALIYGGDISLNSTTQLGGPVKDAIGNQGFAGQILLSDSSGRVSWTNYSAGLTYQGTWNAATNTPTLTSGQGVNGHFYIVNVAGNTSLDGETDWKVGDWAVFVEQGINDKWEKIDNTSVLIGEGTPNTIAMWVGGTTPSTTLNDSIITELNNVISIAGDLSTQGLEVNKYLRDGAGNDGTDGQVLTSTTVNGDKEVVWTTPTTGTVTGSGTGQVLSKFSGTGTGQTVLEDSLVSESSSSSLISGLTKSQTGQGGTVQFQQIGPCNPGGGGQVSCSMADVPNVDLSTDPFTGSGAGVVQGITFNFLTTTDADDFRTLHGITNTGLCSFGGGSAASSFDLTLLFDNGATITFNVPQGQVGIACPFTDQVSLGLYRSGQNAQQYGTALTYVSGSGSISNGDSTVSSIKVSIAATLDMSTNKITNVVNPTDAQDAATKSYVDSTTVSGSGTIGTLPVFTGTDVLGDSNYKQNVSGDTVDILTKTVTDASAYTINTNIGKLTRQGVFPGAGALTSNVTIGAQYTYGDVDMYGSNIELHTYNLPPSASSPITLWSSSTSGIGIQLRTDGGSISNLAGTYSIQATGAGAGSSPEAIQIISNTGIKFQGQGDAANINFRSYNTNLLDSGDINFISETEQGQAGNITISSIATDAAGTAGEIRLAGAGISTSATDAVPLGLIIASNGHVKTGSVGDTYTINAGVKSGTSVPLNLDAASGTDSTVSLTEGTGITLTRTSATEITIDGLPQGVTSVTGDSTTIAVTSGNTPQVSAITTGGVGAGSTSLATGAQIQTAITNSAANYLPLTGGTMTGAIALPGSPTLALEAATKSYVDNTLAGSGSLIFQGSYDAVNNVPNLTSGTGILKGWTYAVTAGPSTSFWSPPLDVGDLVIANIDNPSSASDWTEVQSNIGIAGSGTTDLGTTKGIAGFNSNDFTVSSSGWVEAKDFNGSTPGYVPDATGAVAGTFLKEDGTWSTAGVTGTGTQNYVTKWSAGGTGIENSTIFDTGTNVGIGTTTPLQKLNVSGNISLDKYTGSDFNRIIGINDAAGAYGAGSSYIEFEELSGTGTSNTTKGGNIRFHNHLFGGGTNETLSIIANGNVGIGTTTPSAKLDVAGGADAIARILGTTSAARLDLQTNSYHKFVQVIESDGRFRLYNQTTGSEQLTVLNGGNVGIGTSSPTQALHVAGNLELAADWQIGSNDGSYWQRIRSEDSSATDANAFNFETRNGSGAFINHMTITNSGKVGIGTTSPDTKLHIESTSNTNSPILTIENDSAKQIELGVVRSIAGSQPNTSFLAYDNDFRFIAGAGGTNEVMRIDSNGKVGIGTDQPEVSLDLGNKTDALQLPAGDNTARAAISNPFGGMIRYNTTDDQFEGYSGVGAAGSWGALGGGAPSIHKETFSNLASNTFDFLLPVNINPTDENYVNVFIDGVYQNTDNINSVTTNTSNITTVSLVSAAPAGTSVEIVATT